MAHEITADSFDEQVLQTEETVLVDFWGAQCAPCLALMPKIEKLEEKYGEQLKVAKVNAPKNKRLCLKLRVLNLPTFLIYCQGKEVERLSGNNLSIDNIEDSVKKHIS